MVDLEALEAAARKLLTPMAYDYAAGGADDELTVADNEAAWGRMRLRPRMLRDVSTVTTATTVLGTPVALPVLVAPTGYHRLFHDEGEPAAARGAAAAGTLMVVSSLATVTLEEVAAAAPDAPRWFQLYALPDRGWNSEVIQRAAGAGYRALVLTVDVTTQGMRRRDERNAFTLPEGLTMANLPSGGRYPMAAGGLGVALASEQGSALAHFANSGIDNRLTFADLEWFRAQAPLPLLVKGILRGDDARAAVDAGADGVVVSNHGGRQLDTAVATAEALAEVVDAVGADAEVYVDGGVRRGTDVLKALALGARAVLLGRPVVWGLATGGAAGVQAVLDHFRLDVERTLRLSGCRSLAEVTRDLVA